MLLGVYSFFITSIFRWRCTRFNDPWYIISWLTHRWPFRCTIKRQTMMAQINPSLRAVKFHQVTALHSSILGDSLHCNPLVGSSRTTLFCRYSSKYNCGRYWSYSRTGLQTYSSMNPDDALRGDLEPLGSWVESELTLVSIWHLQPCCTWLNVG